MRVVQLLLLVSRLLFVIDWLSVFGVYSVLDVVVRRSRLIVCCLLVVIRSLFVVRCVLCVVCGLVFLVFVV